MRDETKAAQYGQLLSHLTPCMISEAINGAVGLLTSKDSGYKYEHVGFSSRVDDEYTSFWNL